MFSLRGAMALLLLTWSGHTLANAEFLTLTNTYALAPELSRPRTNFNPQGLGYDPSSNELLFIQQGSETIYRTATNGALLGSRAFTGGFAYNSNGHYAVSVAADGSSYYVSDYTGNSNTNGWDLYRVNKATGMANPISMETAAYGGYPIDVRDGLLYRTNLSTFYGYSALNQIRVASVNAPDAILRTLVLNTPGGIADFAVDRANSSIWVMNYSANASVFRYDLQTGQLRNTYSLGLDGWNGGLTFADNTLYHYDWNDSGPSKLLAYSYTPDSAVPEPSTWALMVLGIAALLCKRNSLHRATSSEYLNRSIYK
jgi:hypothetical protein